ncbi:hypothetical protein [Streptomyces sp. WAC06273]|uniref:hypothetical protein n=1 Tax=Streptomyces sp. WAC06273 TaxID=2487422 RepID=UPI000F74B60D|nr:hypothetical protein [Streptomyces sp. WAC06273]RSS71269.1 hypothetical protein EF907_02805 [Streptomyces sp. WAC06273]
MSDVTRQPGAPAERQTQYPGARGAATPETDPGPGPRTEGAAHPRPAGESTGPTETPTTAPAGTPTTAQAGTPTTAPAGTRAGGTDAAHDGGTLLAHDECDRLGERLRHAVAGFVDAPRASVEEADRVLEEITARFTDAVAQRRRTLRTSWHDTDPDDRATSTDTEQLRLALRDYRGLADRLMRL